MSTSQKTFDQVKSILGKLDRRIDAVRELRNNPAAIPATIPGSTAGAMATAPRVPTPAAAIPGHLPDAPALPGTRSPYGRATPIRNG